MASEWCVDGAVRLQVALEEDEGVEPRRAQVHGRQVGAWGTVASAAEGQVSTERPLLALVAGRPRRRQP